MNSVESKVGRIYVCLTNAEDLISAQVVETLRGESRFARTQAEQRLQPPPFLLGLRRVWTGS